MKHVCLDEAFVTARAYGFSDHRSSLCTQWRSPGTLSREVSESNRRIEKGNRGPTRERVAWEAARNKDKAGLAALISEDFTEITEDGVFDKAQILANLDHLAVTSYSPRNIRVKKLAPDTVMLIFEVTVEGIYDGHNFRADSNAASLWMQRSGKWLNIHFQESPMPSISQDPPKK